MGLRIRVGDQEPIAQALKRFRRLLSQHRASWKWHKPYGWRGFLIYYVKPSKIRGVKRYLKKVKARAATLRAKQAGEQ